MEKKNPQPRRHHYLPAYYLRGFSPTGDGLYMIDRDSEKIIGAKTINLANQRDFHVLDGHAEADPQALEKQLSVLEGKFAYAQKDMIAGGFMNPATRSMMIGFLSMMRMRVPAIKEHLATSNAEHIHAQLTNMEKKGLLPTPPEGLEDVLAAKNLQVVMTNSSSLEMMFGMAFDLEVLQLLHKMRPTLLQAPFGTRFITSDQPVTLYHPRAHKHLGVGLTTPDVVLGLALTSRFAFLLSNEPGGPISRLAPQDEVEEMNRRTILMSTKYIFTGENPEAVRPVLKKYSGQKFGFQYEKVSKGRRSGWLHSAIPVGPELRYAFSPASEGLNG
ncbi:DUF4238 domain-containing protein [Herbaspirillum sp. RV1423]|uniref:DUF4238 domain-containing protein n=1 Tax=Herbaspirillum sp. RV1423 TaxID=1443993 RepID=UPI0004B472DE|nr:DUF4238 domain-containing protein [Herbaspirillum sp. RV1423]